ncbi:MAG: poly-gamma-glutamate biosynthesis protein PgsC [Firmicutes bacterium]|nr:poly-gamma-glutamate biosynthesis protein PgsC [Bacillota bacterium]
MYGNELYLALVVGTIFSLIYTEVTGMLPAGLIVAGYIALMFEHPYTILVVLFISGLTYLIVKFGIARVVILYGRRKFVAMVTVGLIIKLLIDYTVPYLPYEFYVITGVGVIVPGIIANTIERQGFVHTLVSLAIVSTATYLIVFGYNTLIL